MGAAPPPAIDASKFTTGGTTPGTLFPRDGVKLPSPSYGDPEKLNASKLVTWQDTKIPYSSAQWATGEYYIRLALTWRMADLYDQAIQWLRRAYGADTTTSMHWARLTFEEDDPDAIPTPVFNEFSGPIENEASRLGKPEYKAYARTNAGANLKQRDAAELAQQVLQDRLREMGWEDEEDRLNLHMPLYGGGVLLSYWDQTFVRDDGQPNFTRIPMLNAMKCPNQDCDFKTANPTVPGESDEHPLPENAMKGGELNRCPQCKDQQIPIQTQSGAYLRDPESEELMLEAAGPELVPFTPIEDELDEQDYFGRDLGRDVPNGQWVVKCVDPRDWYPENMGLDKTNATLNSFTWGHIETLDWLCNRHANGYLVQPEDTQRLMQYHPIAGERGIFFSSMAAGIPVGTSFQNCARVRETVIKPWIAPVLDENGKNVIGEDGRPVSKLNKGRLVVTANGVVLYDGDLMVQSTRDPKKFVERIHCEYIPWKYRSGGRELFGVSLAEQLFDPCDNINEMISQIQDARGSEGQPKWLSPRGLNFNTNDGSTAGAQWTYDPDPAYGPNVKPEKIGNELLNSEVYKEIDNTIDHIQRSSNTQAVETGGVPPGVAAALAIQMLSEQTAERRRARIRRIRLALARTWSHGLRLMHELQDDEVELWVQEKGDWKSRAWKGADLEGMTEIVIDAEPEHDTAVQKQQTLRDGLEAGLFDANSGMPPATRRSIAQALEVKEDFFADQDRQYKAAEREWLMLLESNETPVIDDQLDSDEIHAEQHGLDLLSDKGQDLVFASGWRQALPLLHGWDQQQPQQTAPSPLNPTGIVMVSAYEMQRQLMGPLKSEQEVIAATWQQMLVKASQPTPQNPTGGFRPKDPVAFGKVFTMMTHLAAHQAKAEQEKTAVAMGQQVLAEPGAPSTAGGTQLDSTAAPAQPTPGVAPMVAPQMGA